MCSAHSQVGKGSDGLPPGLSHRPLRLEPLRHARRLSNAPIQTPTSYASRRWNDEPFRIGALSPPKARSLSSRGSTWRSRLPAGAALLGVATLVASATVGLVLPTGHAIYCDRAAPLAILAAMAAGLIALCFRILASPLSAHRRLAPASLLLAAIALFLAASFIKHTYAACSEMEERLQTLRRSRSCLPVPTSGKIAADSLPFGEQEKINKRLSV